MKITTANTPAHTLRHSLKHLPAIAALSLAMTWGNTHAQAMDHTSHGNPGTPEPVPTSTQDTSTASQPLTDGEITRADTRTGKLTIRHGEIRNIGMPPMTMVFALKDASQTTSYKPGDKVRFRVEDENGTLTITQIEMAP